MNFYRNIELKEQIRKDPSRFSYLYDLTYDYLAEKILEQEYNIDKGFLFWKKDKDPHYFEFCKHQVKELTIRFKRTSHLPDEIFLSESMQSSLNKITIEIGKEYRFEKHTDGNTERIMSLKITKFYR
mmetsp:Transcript_24170/g.21475  ORF Transcript_24170/g.21475 Transcript_24170/m.21475 type:complete len:127 (-) Transcript_24170:720-1100(-)